MMKILNAKQMRAAEQYTIAHEPISSIDLMERAGTKCFEWLIEKFGPEYSVHIFCGIGNNGGDGLVMGRLLSKAGYKVNCYAVRFSDVTSAEFEENERKLNSLGVELISINSNSTIPIINDQKTVMVDAIFGAGLNRDVEGFTAELIHEINKTKVDVVAIDMPSGLYVEGNDARTTRAIIQANYTLSLQAPKLSQLLPVNEKYVGELMVMPIGLDVHFLEQMESNNHYVNKDLVKGIILRRKRFSHKGTFGHALIIAGSKGKMGAASLSSLACLRSGAGLVTSHVPKCGLNILQTSVPEAMVDENAGVDYLKGEIEIETKTIGIGPGIGTHDETKNFLLRLIKQCREPMVLDADAINILAQNPSWLKNVPKGSIFTPHPKEFERLIGRNSNGEKRLSLLLDFAKKYHCYVVLKGANTCIGCPDGQIYFNSTGNPGMAAAGSGDILTGIITGLMAQGYSSKVSCIVGVYLHGLAGDNAKEELGEHAMIASDIIDNLGNAFKCLG